MNTLKFKTNINCSSCVASVTPHLNAEKDIKKWEVNINDSNKILTVQTDLAEKEVLQVIEKSGFKAEPIK